MVRYMRVKTGIPGLDGMIEGGFPARSVNLISGPPGSGKSLFGMHYILQGIETGESGMYITLEEEASSISSAASRYGMDMEQEGISLVDFGDIREDETLTFWGLRDYLEGRLKNASIRRLVIDSISSISVQYESTNALRRELFSFCRFLKRSGLTSLLLAESGGSIENGLRVENFVTDSLIFLGYENYRGEYRRTVLVQKMRLTKHDPYKHPFLITSKGVEIYPEETLF